MSLFALLPCCPLTREKGRRREEEKRENYCGIIVIVVVVIDYLTPSLDYTEDILWDTY